MHRVFLKTNHNLFIFIFIIFFNNSTWGQVKAYKEMDNEGINKLERISIMEKYLADLAQTLMKMESKVNDFDGKFKTIDLQLELIRDKELKSIESSIKNLQESWDKKKSTQLPVSSEVVSEEIEKIKKDILTLKNEDIEKIQLDLSTLKFSVESIQKMLKMNYR